MPVCAGIPLVKPDVQISLLLPLFIDLQEGLREFWPRHARRSLGEGGYSVGEMPATLVFFSSVFSVSLCASSPDSPEVGTGGES
jgi:hypothetical protein